MSTQAHTVKDDLDRTDELPRLDVAAYEASLADSGISRESPWLLRHTLEDSWERIPPTLAVESVAPVDRSAKGGGLTANVDRILKRIADLEAEILTTQETNAALSERGELLMIERDQLNARIAALESENARLAEQRILAQELAERDEHKLRSQLHDGESRFQALQAQRALEAAEAERAREALQQRIVEIERRNESLEDEQHSLQRALQASQALAERQAQSIVDQEGWLAEEKATAAQLTRQFAAKLTDYDRLAASLERHACTIEELSSTKEELDRRLQEELASGLELTAQLATAGKALDAQRGVLLEREQIIAQRDAELARRAEEVEALENALRESKQETSHMQDNLAKQREETNRELRRREGLAAELEQAQQANAVLEEARTVAEATILGLQQQCETSRSHASELGERTAELERNLSETARQHEQLLAVHADAQAQIASLSGERDALLARSAELTQRAAEAEQLHADIAQLREEMAAAQAVAREDFQALSAERDRLLSASEDLPRLSAELEHSREALVELREQLIAAQDVTQDSTRILAERTEELTNVRTRLRDHEMAIRGLEHAVRARDELVDQLRAELQTTRDERGILGGQLDKSKTRVKTLTQEIFRRDNQLSELRAELAVHTEALAAIRRDVNRIGEDAKRKPLDEADQMLEPIEHVGAPILLSAKMITIGRTTENDVCIPSKLVSRHHARLLVGPTGVIVEDAGSTNGCFVNGEQVRQQLMHEGDVLEIGGFRYRLRTRSGHDTQVRGKVVPFVDGRLNAPS